MEGHLLAHEVKAFNDEVQDPHVILLRKDAFNFNCEQISVGQSSTLKYQITVHAYMAQLLCNRHATFTAS